MAKEHSVSERASRCREKGGEKGREREGRKEGKRTKGQRARKYK